MTIESALKQAVAADTKPLNKISVLLIDDDFEVFKLLNKVFENQERFAVVGQASSNRIGTVMIQTYQPQIVILNANMVNSSSEEASSIIRKLVAQSPDTKILAIVSENDSSQIFRVVKSGASGCLGLEDLDAGLTQHLEHILKGDVIIPPRIAAKFVNVLQQVYGPKPEDQPAEVIIKSLTAREKQLLLLMIKGFSYEQISEMCDITVSTVKTHFNAIFCKMGVKNRVQAIGIAMRQDIQLLVEPELMEGLNISGRNKNKNTQS
jgi:DNA-binding NarL/FixJ family response regulator